MRLLRREAALADDGPRGAAVEGRAAPGGQHRAGMQAVQRTQDQPFGDRVRPIETGETAMSDGPFLKRILLACSRGPARIFRVNTGQGWVGKSWRAPSRTTVELEAGDVVIRQARPLHAGLVEGGADLIGWRSRVIQPE